MKLYQVLELNNLYQNIKDSSMPIKTAYKFAMLMQKAETQINFYNQHFKEILDTYAKKKDVGAGIDGYVYSEDGSSIIIQEGKEQECSDKILELRELEVDLDEIKFTLEELDGLNLTLNEISCLMPLIED